MSALPKPLTTSVMEVVNRHVTLPFQPYPCQAEDIERLAPLPRVGLYDEPGCGKTVKSTCISIYKHALQEDAVTIVIVPPILISQWVKWLNRIEGIGRVVGYQGTPKERAAIRIEDADYVVVSIQIFKKEKGRFAQEFKARPRIGIVDEATSVKNVGTDNYKSVRDFFAGHDLMLLTGTPLSNPGDAYAYVKLISPLIYASERQFRNVHVAGEDFFGNVTKWTNLELMQQNLLNNSCRTLKEQMLPYLKQPIFMPIEYELDAKHRKLYKQLMDEQILLLETGEKIDATSASRLYHAAQQIVTNLERYSGNENDRSRAWDIVDNTIEELGINNGSDKKLIIYAQYKVTNRKLVERLAPYGAVACYSEVSRAQQTKNVERFRSDPTCKVLVAQPLSAGYGVDELQNVCHDVLFLETPITPSHFHQGVSRVYRDGQKHTPNIRIAIALDTIQVRLHSQLLSKDELVNKVQIGFKDLKEMIYGK